MPEDLVFANTKLSTKPDGTMRCDGWPVAGEITQRFGIPSVTGNKHGGMDIAADTGTPVRAPAAGILKRHSLDEQAWQFGNWVVLDHQNTKWYSAYGHLSKFEAPEGPVDAGAVIGYVGNTGISTGPHLHWAVGTQALFALDFDQLRDPASFIGTIPAAAKTAPAPGAVTATEARFAALEKRMERLERIVCANGVRIPVPGPDGAQAKDANGALRWQMLTGEAALDFVFKKGDSLHLAIALMQDPG
ncbi:MAG: M23 family metallopeptidase [Chloroflexi bacterium]|nr:M23 family metallopeptidase [Chloroflexota bacterium]